MICSISGEPAKEPVLSPKSGSVFEKSIITKLLEQKEVDPINDEPLSISELIPISIADSITPPKPPTINSIPGLLSTFQNEWDSIAIEIFTLRKQLHKAREELSAALYHHDAAVRVAAKAIKERDEARASLQQLAVSIGKGTTDNDDNNNMEIDTAQTPEPGIPVREINKARESLFALHKSQKPILAVGEDSSISISLIKAHGTSFKKATSSCYDISSKKLLVGSPIGTAALYDFSNPSKTQIHKIANKGSELLRVGFVDIDGITEPVLIYRDNSIKIGNNSKTAKSFKTMHTYPIITYRRHPSLKHLFVTFATDGTFALNDASTLKVLYRSFATGFEFTCGDIHVDGALIAGGISTGEVIIYNLTNGVPMAEVQALADINDVLFAPNGYWLFISSSEDHQSRVDVFDLRKGVVTFKIELNSPARSIAIDPTSQILICTQNKQISYHRYNKKAKNWSENIGEFETSDVLVNVNWTGSQDDATTMTRFIGVGQGSTVSEYEIKV